MFDEQFLFFLLALLGLFLFLVFPIWALILLHAILRRQDSAGPAGNAAATESRLAALERAVRNLQGNLLKELREWRAAPDPEPGAPPSPAAPFTPPIPVALPPPPVAGPMPEPLPVQAVTAVPTMMPPPLPPPPVRAAAPAKTTPAPGPDIESAAFQLLRKAWNWFAVGEEFRRKDVSAEFAIATNWLMRLGVLILVFGVGFFIKYSIDHGYLGPHARLAASTLFGAVMLAGGLAGFGKRYHLLAQGLAGGGIVVLYFSTYAAHGYFGLVPVTVSFAAMAGVTLVAGVLAVRFRSMLIAVLGLLGGYLTPAFLSTGQKNLPVLFAYLVLLGIGVVGVAWKRQWPVLTWLAFLGHWLLAGAALARYFEPADFPLVMPFLAVFFLQFSTAVCAYNLATRTRASLLELVGLMLAATVFFGIGYWAIMRTWPGRHDLAAWLALALCAYYVLHAYLLRVRRLNDPGLLAVFLGLGAVFLSVTLPLLFSKGWLTVTWAVEALVLLWLAIKLRSPILRTLAGVVYAILLGRVCFHDLPMRFAGMPAPDSFRAYLGLLLPRLTQFGFPVLSLAGAWHLLRREAGDPAAPRRAASAFGWPGLALSLMYLILFYYLNFEMRRFFECVYAPLIRPGYTFVWIAFGFIVLAHRRSLGVTGAALLWSLLVGAVLVKLMVYDMAPWNPSLAPLRYGADWQSAAAFVRLADFAVILGFLVFSFRLFLPDENNRALGRGAGWLALAILLLYLTLEAGSALHAFLPAFHGGGISLLWALYALALLVAGLRRQVPSLRIVGLALFTHVVGKIFLSDLARLHALYRIIAFLALGAVLLLASFLYMKNKDRFESRPS